VAVVVLASAVVVSSASAATHKIQRPTLKRGSLNIEGTRASDKIALRLKARNARILQVDVGDDGKADFSFKRKQVARISVHAGSGNDLVRIDERNGVFTARIKTLLDGGVGNDTLIGGSERRRCSAPPTWRTETAATITSCSGGDDLRLESGRRKRPSTAKPAPTRRASTVLLLRSTSRLRDGTHVRFARDVGT
jgi:hypothetical protein